MNVPAAGGQPTLKLRLAKQATGGRLMAEGGSKEVQAEGTDRRRSISGAFNSVQPDLTPCSPG